MSSVIKTEALTKYFGKTRGIEGVTLSVGEGDIFGFIGPNGAGKSTTIRLLLGLIRPSGGNASVFRLDIRNYQSEIQKNVGYMPSEAIFYPEMRVSEIISLSARLHGVNCSKEAAALCRRFELDTKRRIRELSLGNRRKVSIVCALQHNPRLLILDEPSSGLDPLMQAEFFSLLLEKNRAGATVFLSSHVLSEVSHYCGRAGIVRSGELIRVSSVAELTKTAARRVVIRGDVSVPLLPGLRDVTCDKGCPSFLYSGEVKTLIAALDGLEIQDISITEPDLNEVFLHYYSAGEGTKVC